MRIFKDLRSSWRLPLLLVAAYGVAYGHAPPIYVPVPPLRVQGAALLDSTGTRVLLRGVVFDALGTQAVNPITYRLIRQRWNANTVRIPLQVPQWRAPDGAAYLERAGAAVAAARQEGLIVVLAAMDPENPGLPAPDLASFWTACARQFKDDPGVVFSLFHEPSAALIPGYTEGTRRDADWEFWRNGGVQADGRAALGMQSLADAIRATGALAQVIAAPAFHDRLGLQGFGAGHEIASANVMYEVHPAYDHESTDQERETNFGFLRARFPIYAGVWGMPLGRDEPACRAIMPDPVEASSLLFQTLVWFDLFDVSWTAAEFKPGSLIRDFDEFTPTELGSSWTCDGAAGQSSGIGQTLLLWTTGDPLGFGSILPEYTASLAGGPPKDLSPGELVGLYGQGLGPEIGVTGQLDRADLIPAQLAGVRVFFDEIPAPIVFADSFQVYVQVPYEIAGRGAVTVQLYYRDVPSNRIRLGVVAASPEPFTQAASNTDALAINEDARMNSVRDPAARGSVVVLNATGSGQTFPPGTTGAFSDALPELPVEVTIGQKRATVLSWRGSPEELGRQQVVVRVPVDLPATVGERFAVVLRVGPHASRSGVFVWIR